MLSRVLGLSIWMFGTCAGHGFIVLKKPELVGKDAGLGLAAQDSAKSNAEGEEVPPSV